MGLVLAGRHKHPHMLANVSNTHTHTSMQEAINSLRERSKNRSQRISYPPSDKEEEVSFTGFMVD